MSTWIYLTCECHIPRLVADEESGQHANSEIEQIREWVRDRDALLVAWDATEGDGFGDYFLRHTLQFLSQHRTCVIGAVDEYDRDWSMTNDRTGA